VTRRTESPPDDESGGEILRLEPLHRVDTAGLLSTPLLSWLIARVRPAVTVELGPADWASLRSTCDAVRDVGPEARCIAVRLSSSDTAASPDVPAFRQLLAECAEQFADAVTGYENEAESLAALAGGTQVDLLHVSLLDRDDVALPDLVAWFDALAPGGTVVVTSTAAGASPTFAEAKRLVSERYPSARVALGPSTEALVAQAPVDGAAPTVELLRNFPSAAGDLLDIVTGSVEPFDHLDDESMSPVALRAMAARWIERQQAEREALLSALRAYQDLTTRLSLEASDARSQLAAQIESARLEREHLVTEFLDRLDVLSAKISTSAARFASELEQKDRLVGENEQRMLAYAGQAATAQSVIDDIRRSSSWRLTAPLRLMSRIAARRARPRNETAR
jgi:hypothetical protein